MLKKLFALLGIGTALAAEPAYQDESVNHIYELLFCDRPETLAEASMKGTAPPWSVLFAEVADVKALEGVALNPEMESRIRMLAFNRLRKEGKTGYEKVSLGVILELSLPNGLDTLAAFSDGEVRYINHSGAMAFVLGGVETFRKETEAFRSATEAFLAGTGPSKAPRKPAPTADQCRLTLLTSDGMHVKELAEGDPVPGKIAESFVFLLRKLREEGDKEK